VSVDKTPEWFMNAAVKLARRGVGLTSPNPAVGALVVKGGIIIGSGWHRRAGLPHAELLALDEAGPRSRGADMYVTLEPCRHQGKTPPCTRAIIGAGIKRVFVGMRDPNPLVNGRGMTELRRAGVVVASGVLSDRCRALNEPYIKHITTGLPFVTLKLAMTLDGRIAAGSGESKWISGSESRRLVHRMRSRVDAVMVGSGTVVKDDPRLTVRGIKDLRGGPLKVVVDSSLKIPPGARVFKKGPLVIFTSPRAKKARITWAEAAGAEVAVLPSTKEGISLKRVLRALGKRGVTSVMIEGGSTLAASIVRHSLADRIQFFLSPHLLGGDAVAAIGELGVKGLNKAAKLKRITTKRINGDILVEGFFG
jgi:diaminohydroxyphosphoribosylaminopyrimidine deaminase/5-amino-6-(5-phosphoribosylamino)uracil reductase